jgi:YegS/Rv2252/BmrU family lipid kinase
MSTVPKPIPQVLIVMNPAAGVVNARVLKLIIERQFHAAGWACHFHLTQKDEDLSAILTGKVITGVDLIVAAGGDGTIAAVAASLIHSTKPLGIIPTGTWNAIARHLMIPFNPLRAIAIMTGKHKIRRLDLMSIGDSYHAMNLGIGFSATMVKDTKREEKRKFGNLAYYSNLIKQVFGMQLKRYEIEADGRIFKGRATEIMVANYGMVGLNLIESSLNIHPDDGKVDVLIFKTRTILDLPVVFWHAIIQRRKRTPKYHQLSASKELTINTKPSMHVQADGELIGKTPVKVTVIPRCVRVIVPN